MSRINILTIKDVIDLHVDDFLKQDQSEQLHNTLEYDSDYVCQNPTCDHDQNTKCFHTFDVNSEEHVIICEKCYDSGYRFCLFTLEVIHMSKLEPVLDDMYALPEYHQNQLNSTLLEQVKDIRQYLTTIGIENPKPEHSIICLD